MRRYLGLAIIAVLLNSPVDAQDEPAMSDSTARIASGPTVATASAGASPPGTDAFAAWGRVTFFLFIVCFHSGERKTRPGGDAGAGGQLCFLAD